MIRWLAPLLLLCLVAGAYGLWTRLDQPISTVRVTGSLDAHEQAQIRQAVSQFADAGLLRLRLEAVRREIRRLSWPQHVTVRRLWPAGLAIDVVKQRRVARWGESAFVSTEGTVIPRLGESVGAQLPLLACANASPQEAMEVFQLLSAALTPTGAEIAELNESALGEWTVLLRRGDEVVQVLLGRERLAERLDRVLVVYGEVLTSQLQAVEYVDARYANGVAVRWQEQPPAPLIAFKTEESYASRR